MLCARSVRVNAGGVYCEVVIVPLPPKPEPPDPRDCCGSGCVRCIFDLYEDEFERWRETVARLSAERPDVEENPGAE